MCLPALTIVLDHNYDAISHRVSQAYHRITGTKASGSPAQQLDRVTGRARDQGYTISARKIAFTSGADVELMVLSPSDPASTTLTTELRVYSLPAKGHVRRLLTFRPQPLAVSGASSTALAGVLTPQTLGIRIRDVASLNGTPGVQVLLDLYDRRLPSLGVMPLLLSRSPADDTFALEPLLDPRGTGITSMASRLSTYYLQREDWANQARTSLYDRPLAVRNAASPKTVLKGFVVTGYSLSAAPIFGAGAATLTLATGYVARGANFPMPSVMQILVWRLDLAKNPPRARTFSSIPSFGRFPSGATQTQIQAALERAVKGLPPTQPKVR